MMAEKKLERTSYRRAAFTLMEWVFLFVSTSLFAQIGVQKEDLSLGRIMDGSIRNTMEVDSYRAAPSLMFGNLFNQKSGPIEAPTSTDMSLHVFTVEEIRQFPGFSGNHVWIYIEPTDPQSPYCTEGCWVFLGVQTDNPFEVSTSQFTPVF